MFPEKILKNMVSGESEIITGQGHSTVSLPSITGQIWQLKGNLIFNHFIGVDSFAI